MKTIKIQQPETPFEKMWIEKEIGSLWYNHNDREKDNSLDKTIRFLSDIKKKKKISQYVNIRVQPRFNEGELGDDSYIVVFGFRKETNSEFKERMKHTIRQKLSHKTRSLQSHAYYNSDSFKNELKQLRKFAK